ncbi:MAG: tRNA lysidine(34) synthetase TilS [Proteobacteria bacterium]|nr:tRNA lysidine(34) synthetase TilS [Pseudomonadota bacterium]
MTHDFIKQLRTRMTDAERLLWYHLRAHRLLDQKFRRQQPIGPYIADFVHFGSRVIVEADGGQHNESSRDARRDAWFEAQGFRVLRFWNHDILTSTDAVLEQILAAVTFPTDSLPPLPNPSPARGEGLASDRHDAGICFPSPHAGEGGASAPGEGDSSAKDPGKQSPRNSPTLPHSTDVLALLHPAPDSKLVVGFSGGLDSTVLLHALATHPSIRGRGLRAVHVHHGLQADADAWAAHCEAVCAQWDIRIDIARIQVDLHAGRGMEAAARAARLDAFRTLLNADEVLALAHHRDDQAETVLLRLLRGAGGDGLAAIRRRSRLGSLHLWRPLFDVPRSVLRRYADAHELRWIEDPSNESVTYDRNFLRHRVLPLLRERWPQADRSLARSAALLAEQAQLLDVEVAVSLKSLQLADDALSIPGLLALPRAQRARVLRVWLRQMTGLAPGGRWLATLERDLLRARSDGEARVVWASRLLQRWRDGLHARISAPAWPNDWSATWDGQSALQLPDRSRLELLGVDGFDATMTVRARRGGERIRLPGRGHSHELKHVLQDRGVPPWSRIRMPLLFAVDGELLAAGDAIVAARLDAWLRENDARLRWLDNDQETLPVSE